MDIGIDFGEEAEAHPGDVDAIDVGSETVSSEPVVKPAPAAVPPPAPEAPPAPPAPSGLTRENVVDTARVLAATITGVAAQMETGKVSPEFLMGWRRWCGAFLGYYHRLERNPFDIQATARELVTHAQSLRKWRQGLKEQNQAAALETAHPKAELLRPTTWPTWAKVGVGLGLTYGAYRVIQTVVEGWSMNTRETGRVIDATARVVPQGDNSDERR